MEPIFDLHTRSWRILAAILLLTAFVLSPVDPAGAEQEPEPELAFVLRSNIRWGKQSDYDYRYVTNDWKRDQQPVISPDGQTVVFARTFDYSHTSLIPGDTELVRINTDGTGLQILTHNSLIESWPAWSPDGTRLAFAAGGVYVMPISAAGAGTPVRLTTDDLKPENLVWSPDGTRLAFNGWPSHEETNPNQDDMELFVLTVANGQLTRLTSNDAYDGDPAWSPDGSRLAYETRVNSLLTTHLHLIDAAGGPSTPLVTNGDSHSTDPAWSPDGALIAYAEVTYGVEIKVIRPDGTTPDVLVNRQERFEHPISSSYWEAMDIMWASNSRLLYGEMYEYCGSFACATEVHLRQLDLDSGDVNTIVSFMDGTPSWWLPTMWSATSGSATSDRLVYIDHARYLHTRDISAASSGQTRQLTFDVPINGDPAWSPSGDWIAFSSRNNSDYDIHISDAEGQNRRALTTHPGNDWNPGWSLNGRIAFTSNRDGNWELYVMDANGNGQTNLTNTPGMAENDAAWSPDGTRLAYARQENGNWDIYVMNGDGSGVTRLTSHAASDRYPTWSPDGTRIAFQSDRDGNEEIYILTVAGALGNEVNLTRHPQDESEPTWSPDGSRLAFTRFDEAEPAPWSIVVMRLSDRTENYFTESGSYPQPAWRPIVSELTPRVWVPVVGN